MVIELIELRATLSHIPYQRVVKYAGARSSIALVWLALSSVTSAAQMVSDQITYELSTRYTPYADGAAVLDLGQITTKTVAKARTAFDWSLVNLHLALDPGHIGGNWAEWESRNFRISREDHWVREGEL